MYLLFESILQELSSLPSVLIVYGLLILVDVSFTYYPDAHNHHKVKALEAPVCGERMAEGIGQTFDPLVEA
jgi:hypothetical protein